MNTKQIDELAARAGELSRRGSLLALGGAALATLFAPSEIAEAAKRAKKAKKRAAKKCRQQKGQCRTYFSETYCAGGENPELCEVLYLPCCDFLADCQPTAFLDCVRANES
jgi:hypothetical protein